MRHKAMGVTIGRFAVLCSILGLPVTPVIADEKTHVPVAVKKKLLPGETQTLNPQPIPPGKPATVIRLPKNDARQSIIFVGGRNAKPIKTDPNASVPIPKKSKASAETPTPC